MGISARVIPLCTLCSEGDSSRGASSLEDALGLAHGGLEVDSLDVLPVLLEEGHEEVDGNVDVGEELLLGHLDVADGDAEAKGLLELELDGGLDLVDLLSHLVLGSDDAGELARLVEAGAQKTGDHLDEGLGGEESVVLLGELLDKLLVLVELLEVLHVHVGDRDLLGKLAVRRVSEDADGHVRARDTGKLDGTRETLVLLGIVVLEADLELDGLAKLALLVRRLLVHHADGLADGLRLKLTADRKGHASEMSQNDRIFLSILFSLFTFPWPLNLERSPPPLPFNPSSPEIQIKMSPFLQTPPAPRATRDRAGSRPAMERSQATRPAPSLMRAA